MKWSKHCPSHRDEWWLYRNVIHSATHTPPNPSTCRYKISASCWVTFSSRNKQQGPPLPPLIHALRTVCGFSRKRQTRHAAKIRDFFFSLIRTRLDWKYFPFPYLFPRHFLFVQLHGTTERLPRCTWFPIRNHPSPSKYQQLKRFVLHRNNSAMQLVLTP
jgi:hypothetical protein